MIHSKYTVRPTAGHPAWNPYPLDETSHNSLFPALQLSFAQVSCSSALLLLVRYNTVDTRWGQCLSLPTHDWQVKLSMLSDGGPEMRDWLTGYSFTSLRWVVYYSPLSNSWILRWSESGGNIYLSHMTLLRQISSRNSESKNDCPIISGLHSIKINQ